MRMRMNETNAARDLHTRIISYRRMRTRFPYQQHQRFACWMMLGVRARKPSAFMRVLVARAHAILQLIKMTFREAHAARWCVAF